MQTVLGTPPTRESRARALCLAFALTVVALAGGAQAFAVTGSTSLAWTPWPAPTCTGIRVGTTDDLSAVVAANPAGTTFCISSGVHRLQTWIDVKPGDQLLGADGAVISGAKVLSGF